LFFVVTFNFSDAKAEALGCGGQAVPSNNSAKDVPEVAVCMEEEVPLEIGRRGTDMEVDLDVFLC